MKNRKLYVYPVLLAGGSGTRLWPVSRELYPKQLVNFIGDDSLVQSTVKRLSPVLDNANIRIVCGREHFFETSRHLEQIGISAEDKIIGEPCGRNTAPAILLAIMDILKKENDAVLCVFPADHIIKDVGSFHRKLMTAVRLAEAGYIVTFGIKPHYPETGYGYIEGTGKVGENDALYIKQFVEKPDLKTAKEYVKSGIFFWNSGMFAFKASAMMEELKKYQPELLLKMENLDWTTKDISLNDYKTLPKISIDHAVMEKTDKGVVVPSDFGWSDIGSWKSLYDFLSKDKNGNVIEGDAVLNKTENCFIMGYERLIATNTIKNMVIVETPDSVFVSDMDNSRDVKSIVKVLKEKGRREYQQHRTVHHVWGTATLLENKEGCTVERIKIYPGLKLEVESNRHVIKHLVVISGSGISIINGQNQNLLKGKTIVVEAGKNVVIENTGNETLNIIEMRLT